MENTEKLIEYYFQRRIAGVDSEVIRHSLQEQLMEDGERELILLEVERRERHHQRLMERQRYGRYLLAGGTLLLAVALVLAFLIFGRKAEFSLLLTGFIFTLGCGGVAGGFFYLKT